MRDVFTDADHKDVVVLVVRRSDGTILIYGEGEEPTVILPPQPTQIDAKKTIEASDEEG